MFAVVGVSINLLLDGLVEVLLCQSLAAGSIYLQQGQGVRCRTPVRCLVVVVPGRILHRSLTTAATGSRMKNKNLLQGLVCRQSTTTIIIVDNESLVLGEKRGYLGRPQGQKVTFGNSC